MNTQNKITAMVEGGAILSKILTETISDVTAGMTTLAIEEKIARKMDAAGAQPSFKTVNHYPYYSCIGLNAEVVHSLPSSKKVINQGDLLKVDAGLIWQDWHTDMSWTVQIGQSETMCSESPFLAVGKLALADAIDQCRVGKHIGDISQAIQHRIESAGYSIVKQLTGHCIGKKLHEKPFIPGYLSENINKTPQLTSGMTLAIEVIYCQGNGKIVIENDGWTISTQDGKMSGLFEQTIAIMPEGPLILTPVPDGF